MRLRVLYRCRRQVQDGHAVAFTAGTTIPSGAVMDLATSRDVKISTSPISSTP